MRAALFALSAASLSLGAVTTPATARDYPYCVQGRSTGIPGDCSYQTYEQCQASASGRAAFCNINPRFAFQQQRAPRRGYPDQRGYDAWPNERFYR